MPETGQEEVLHYAIHGETSLNIAISDNVSLAALTVEDAPDIFELVEAERDMLTRFLYWVPAVTDLPSARRYITERIGSDEPCAMWWKFVVYGRTAGVFGVKSINAEQGCAEVGYWLATTAHGMGAVSNSIRTVSKHLRDIHDVQFLDMQCLHDNRASIAVAHRAGGVHFETVSDYLTMDGKLQDLLIFRAEIPPSIHDSEPDGV